MSIHWSFAKKETDGCLCGLGYTLRKEVDRPAKAMLLRDRKKGCLGNSLAEEERTPSERSETLLVSCGKSAERFT